MTAEVATVGIAELASYMRPSVSLQKLKVVPLGKKQFGKFHTGDSYIVLEVCFTNLWPATLIAVHTATCILLLCVCF
jgi:hypothetical protein